MIKKIYAVNLALFAVVVGMVSLLMTESYTIPPEPPSMTAKTPGEKTEEKTVLPEKTYAHLGTVPIFDTIIQSAPKAKSAMTPVRYAPPPTPARKRYAAIIQRHSI